MNIAFLVRSLDCGGAERQLALLAIALRRRGHRVSVTVFYPNGFYENVLRENGVRVNTVGRRGRWDFIRPLIKALASLKAEAPDIVHAYMTLGNIVSGLFKRYLRPAKIVWGVRNSGTDAQDYDWLSHFGTRLERALAWNADLVIYNSTAGLLAGRSAGFPLNRLIAIPNGFDPTEFFIDPAARQRVREELGIAPGEVLIGRVGRLDPVKDYPGFLKAAVLMLAKDPRLRFVCVGSGAPSYSAELKRIGDELGLADRVIWTGLVKHMRDVYNALDVLVSSSKSNEGFPNVILEAMACGVACVSTDVGDSKEMIGDFGRIVPPKDYAAMAEACLNAVHSRLSPALVRASALERFSVDMLVGRTEKTLGELVGWGESQDLITNGERTQSALTA